MPRRPEHLQLRGRIYWVRVRVPDDLRPIIGKLEVRRSLATSDPSEAKRRVRIERIKIEAEFDDARERSRATGDRTKGPVSLTEEQVWALATRWFVRREQQQATLAQTHPSVELDADIEALQFVEDWDNASHAIHADITALLAEAGLPPASQLSAEWRARLAKTIHLAMIESERRQVNFAAGQQRYALNPAFRDLSAGSALQPGSMSALSLADLIKRFDSDPTRPRATAKTLLKRAARNRVFLEVFGKRTPVQSITRERARTLLDILTALPSNTSKRFPNQKLADVVRIAKERGLQPMSVTTANDYLTAFSALMEHGVREGVLDKNPAAGLRLAADGIHAKDRRLSFNADELRSIFEAPLYVGCVDDQRGYASPGPHKPRRGRFWLPLVALFTGMRLNEICQLTEDDILSEGSVHYIAIQTSPGSEKRLKTRAAARIVPLHSKLIEIGFLAHVESARRQGGPRSRLFPDLGVASTGYASDNASKWFANFLDGIGITDRRKTFHSFRHTFRDALREAAIPIERVRELGGWSSANTEDHYGSGTRIGTLASELEKIQFDVPLNHLLLHR